MPYKYYSTQRPVDIGTYPKPPANLPIEIVNYDGDERIAVEDGVKAWGEITYAAPLDRFDVASYELRPSRYNPDIQRKLHEQAVFVGRYEVQRKMPDSERLTVGTDPRYGFRPKDGVLPEQLEKRSEDIRRYLYSKYRRTKTSRPHGGR